LNGTESFAENQARKKNRAPGVQRGQCGGDGQHAMTCGKKVEYVCEDVERAATDDQPHRRAPNAQRRLSPERDGAEDDKRGHSRRKQRQEAGGGATLLKCSEEHTDQDPGRKRGGKTLRGAQSSSSRGFWPFGLD
jgi:hypothetical protein